MSPRFLLFVTALLGLLAVLLGAFAAHGLSAHVSALRLSQWQTGVNYQFIHTLALGLLWAGPLRGRLRSIAANCFILGTLLFSGSLYLLVLFDLPQLGMVTPLGGFAYISGWFTLIYAALSDHSTEQ